MTRELFSLLLAGSLLIPLISSASGHDRSAAATVLRTDPSPERAWRSLSLPPVPHLDKMPGLGIGTASTKGVQVDMLLGPTPYLLGPFLLQPHSASLGASPLDMGR
jgi:hypothetical protein